MRRNYSESMKHDSLFTPVPVSIIAQLNRFDFTFGFIGSCFSDNIYQRFRQYGLNAWLSEYGTTYNPYSIEKQLLGCFDLNVKYNFLEANNRWYTWESAHSLSASSRESLDVLLKEIQTRQHKWLKQTNFIFITLGSAWVYQLKSSGEIVANCHKQPAGLFEKRLMEIEEIQQSLSRIVSTLKELNPGIHLVFTVSPVRHIRDGMVENSRSKARLLEACQWISAHQPSCTYFPSFEILMDELRDYRFYEADKIHPNSIAIEIIWDRLKSALFDASMDTVFSEVFKIRQLEAHRISSDASQQMIAEHISRIDSHKSKLTREHAIVW